MVLAPRLGCHSNGAVINSWLKQEVAGPVVRPHICTCSPAPHLGLLEADCAARRAVLLDRDDFLSLASDGFVMRCRWSVSAELCLSAGERETSRWSYGKSPFVYASHFKCCLERCLDCVNA